MPTYHPAKHEEIQTKEREDASPPGDPQRHSPGRVGGRDEEIDDHAVGHVQTVLHRPVAEKAGYGPCPGPTGFGGAWAQG